MAETENGIILVTAGSEEEAKAIAIALVTAKLAACVTITPTNSIYTWQGEIETASEWQLTIKTNLNLFDSIQAKIEQLHSYDTPEIIALPIVKGSQAYLTWLSSNTLTG